MTIRLLTAAALAAAVVGFAGCGGSDDPQSALTTAPTTTTPAQTTPSTDGSTGTTTGASKPKPKPKPKPEARPTTITIRVVGGRPQNGIVRPKLEKNEKVVLVVRSDIAEEVHLHGYDISGPVKAGGRLRLAFVAKLPGRFELELENSGVQLAELTVQ